MLAAVDTVSSRGWTKKKRSSSEGTLETMRHQGAVVESTGGDVQVWAGDTLMVQASRIAAAGDIDLAADDGLVALLSGTDSTFQQQKHQKTGLVWQSARDKGESATDVVMTELEAGGNLSIDARAGIIADYRDTGGLNASLAALAQDPATAWVAQLATRDDVTWRAVQQAYTSWDHKSQGLSGPAAMVIAIAVTVATQGMGAGLVGATGATSAAMANAAFSALISQASISLINNQGDLGKVLKELGSVQTVKNLATAMATAGLTHGIAEAAGVSGEPTAAFSDRLAYQGIKAATGVALNTTIGGADFGDALTAGALSMATAMASQVLFQAIGDMAADLKIEEGDITKVIAHALAGCAAGQITRNCVGGAIGAGLQELAGDTINKLSDDPQKQVQLSGLIAAAATMLVGGAEGAVSTANAIAQDARTYNRQLHVREVQKLRELAPDFAAKEGISEAEATRRLLAQALRNVDQTYYEAHSQWDQSADAFLGRHAQGYITVAGKDVLMFTAGGAELKADPKLLADTWSQFKPEFEQAYLQTPVYLASDKFATQQKILDAYLTAVSLLPYGGSVVAALARYEEAARNGDTETMRDIEMSLPLELVSSALHLGRVASGIKAVDKAADTLQDSRQVSDVRRISVEEANAPFISRGWSPPYSGGSVRTFTTETDLSFVRVGTPGNPTGQFLARADEIAGMTPQQIQQHLALPQVPTHISDVTVPAGTPMQMGRVAPQPQFGGAPGGGVQYQLKANIPDYKFGQQRPLQ